MPASLIPQAMVAQVMVALPGKLPFWFNACCEAVLQRHAQHNVPASLRLRGHHLFVRPSMLHSNFHACLMPVCSDIQFVICHLTSFPVCIAR